MTCTDFFLPLFCQPFYHSRKQYLRVFVSTVCKRGDGAKLSRFPFKGLQDEVERLLLLKAQQSPVLSSPDYYSTLSAYYTYRGDYRNGMIHDARMHVQL